MRVPLKIVRDSREGGRGRYEASYVLIRPDQFVAWSGNDASAEATAILRRAIGA
jgi:hypothetical protein